MTDSPSVTCPSPARTTLPLRRIDKTVVERIRRFVDMSAILHYSSGRDRTPCRQRTVCCTLLSPRMNIRRELLLPLAAMAGMTGCASIGPPMPPSLELPKPPSDLHAARKADQVTLTWTLPARTTARQRLRYLGKTSVC